MTGSIALEDVSCSSKKGDALISIAWEVAISSLASEDKTCFVGDEDTVEEVFCSLRIGEASISLVEDDVEGVAPS